MLDYVGSLAAAYHTMSCLLIAASRASDQTRIQT